MPRLDASARVARSIRLPRAVWRALDEAALQASSTTGRYLSANALLESVVAAHLESRRAPPRPRSDLGQMRAARAAKQSQDRERVLRQERIVRTLQRAAIGKRRAALSEAMAIVDRWRRDELASPLYIEAWRKLLGTGLPAIANALRVGHGGLSPAALAANSPFLPLAARSNK